MPYYNRDPKRDHNFDNHPHDCRVQSFGFRILGFGFQLLLGGREVEIYRVLDNRNLFGDRIAFTSPGLWPWSSLMVAGSRGIWSYTSP